jgi:hypothetical protein
MKVKSWMPGSDLCQRRARKVTWIMRRFRTHIDTVSGGMKHTTEYSRLAWPGLRSVEDP